VCRPAPAGSRCAHSRRDLQRHATGFTKGLFGTEKLPSTPDTEAKSEKFWLMRRQSFNLLRSKVKDKHTAPFIDDIIVRPEFLPKFIPELHDILKEYNLIYTLAGHAGSPTLDSPW
jgi:FAD/FMN-containing dehydrogenase